MYFNTDLRAPSQPGFRATWIALPRKAALACSLAASLLLPVGAMADESAVQLESIADLALHEQSFSAPQGVIRLKLHHIEDLREPATESAPVTDEGADEIKKQAQARYLAAKLKKQESSVRKYVDLAWAEASKRDQLDPELIIAIIHKESEFRPKVQSRYGAQGLMQVVRRWHGEKLRPSESLFDPVVNIRVGADVLEEYLAQAGGNLDRALRKYSGNARGYVNSVKKESRNLALVAERAASKAMIAQG